MQSKQCIDMTLELTILLAFLFHCKKQQQRAFGLRFSLYLMGRYCLNPLYTPFFVLRFKTFPLGLTHGHTDA